MTTNESTIRICGWMQFKNQVTNEKVTTPAIATVESRPVNYGEKERLSLQIRSPFTEKSGTWDEIKHDCWVQAKIEEAKQWYAVGFTPNDPEIKTVVTKKIDELLKSNDREQGKKKTADRRLSTCRFDEWLKGWATDLVWDPFQYLEASPKIISSMVNEGLLCLDLEENLLHWLDQPPSFTAAKVYSGNKTWQKKESQQKAPEGVPSEDLSSKKESVSDALVQAKNDHNASGVQKNESDLQSVKKDQPLNKEEVINTSSNDMFYLNESIQDLNGVEDYYIPLRESDLPLMEPEFIPTEYGEDVFSAEIRQDIDHINTPSIEQVSENQEQLKENQGQNVLIESEEINIQNNRSNDESTLIEEEKEEEKEEESEKDLIEESIFGGKDLPNFADIVKFNEISNDKKSKEVIDSIKNEESIPYSNGNTPVESSRAKSSSEIYREPLKFSFARYPSQQPDGSIDWTKALLACEGFMQTQAFNLARNHRRATRPDKNKQQSLYSMDILLDLTIESIPFTLLGENPKPRFELELEDSKRLDCVNFALFALGKDSNGVGRNIASVARTKFYREKIAEIFAKSAKIPYSLTSETSTNWIQLSAGPLREDATKVDPDRGLIQWRQPHSEPPCLLCAQLVDEEAKEKIKKGCEGFIKSLAQNKQVVESGSQLDVDPERPIAMLPPQNFFKGKKP